MLELSVLGLQKAIADGSQIVMRKYKEFGVWGQPKVVSSEVALRKSSVVVYDEDDVAHCPYRFYLAE